MHASTAIGMSGKLGRFASSIRPTSRHWKGWVALLGCMGTYSWLALFLGRDVPWDYFNYHAYSAQLLFHDRLAQDFFAAGVQGYLNPIGFLPLALTQYLNLGSMATAISLACLHSLNAFFLYLICRDLSADKSLPYRLAMGIGWVLGAATPVLLTHLGSTFVDPIGSAMIVASAWLTVTRHRPSHMLLAGVLAGIALAVKLSNAGFALAIAATITLPHRESLHAWWKRVSWGAIGMLVGFGLTQGYWSWHLQQTMGNPFFPLFNEIFQSPYYPAAGIGTLRFVPHSWIELASLPYRLAQGKSWVYLELPAPTLVPLATTIAALALCVRRTAKIHISRMEIPAFDPEQRLLALAALASAAWIATSSNGRYGIALFVLLGPTLAIILLKLLPQRYAVLLLALLGMTQVYTTSFVGVQRWNTSKWTPQLVSVKVPSALAASPKLFLIMSSPSHSELIPYLHPDSAFVSLRGVYSIPSAGPAFTRLDSLFSEYDGRIEVLFDIPQLEGIRPDTHLFIKRNSALLDRVGLSLLPDGCSKIRIDDQKPLTTGFNRGLGAPNGFTLMSCRAVRTAPDPQMAELRNQAARIMDAFETKCPDLFAPSRPQIEGVGQGWVRKYFNHDSIALSVQFNRDMLFYGLSGQTSPTYIGKVSDWPRAVAEFRCELPGQGKRGIDFFNENEKDSIWF